MPGLPQLGIAARAIAANAFRSSLTVLSVTIGAFAIVLMSSLAESGLRTLQFGIEDLGGARLLLVVPKEPERAEGKIRSVQRGFTRSERDLLFTDVPHVAELSMYATLGIRDVVADNEAMARTSLIAADSHFLDVYKLRVRRGRAFSEEENREHARVCVVGPKLAAKLWSDSAVGHKLTAGGLRCRVIGELAPGDRFGVDFGFDWQDLVIAPREALAETEGAVADETVFLLKTDDARANEVVKRIVNARLVERHQGIDDFTLYDFAAILSKFSSVFLIMEAVVGLVAGIALVIGGVGVMNMMLVSVSERVREIGIRKAVGATPADIRAQFLAEALLLAGVGGLLGVASGLACAAFASAVIHRFQPTWTGTVSTRAAIAATVVSLGVGLVFGYFPARSAGRLDPTEAMRR